MNDDPSLVDFARERIRRDLHLLPELHAAEIASR